MNIENMRFPTSKSEYIELLDEIEMNLCFDNAKKIDQLLEKIYIIKPINIRWFLLKAKTLTLLNKDTADVDRIILNKYLLSYENDNIDYIIDYFIFKSEINNDLIEKERLLYHKYIKIASINFNANRYVENINKQLYENLQIFCSSEKSEKNILDIAKLFYIQNNFICYAVFCELYRCNFINNINEYQWLIYNVNYSYFCRILKKIRTFIIVEDDNKRFCEAISKALIMLGHKVYFIHSPEKIEVDNKIDINKTLQISLENINVSAGIISVYPIELIYSGESLGSNIELIIDYINSNFVENGLSTVITTGHMMDDLCNYPIMKKKLERLYPFKAFYFESNITFGWCGDYLSYISELCEFDARSLINQNAEVDYSIVIPARNSAETLTYTLKSCLNLNYNGKFEILVCDNSSLGYNNINTIVRKFNDDRIKYIRTPYELPLSKSFEYAFLHARGEFILSIGSDDGILPWALKVIDAVRKNFENEEVILWERGFYAWPGFNKGQQNQFIIPNKYINGDINICFEEAACFCFKLKQNYQNMYILPSLYINSGFKRSYIKRILEKTGRLWDGAGQDIYMGILNVFLNKKILNISYPLTIAGMSCSSIGASYVDSEKSIVEFRKKGFIDINQIYCESINERCIARVESDALSIYSACRRLISRGILSEEVADSIFNFQQIYDKQISLLQKEDILYEEKIGLFYAAAKKISKDFYDYIVKKYRKILDSIITRDVFENKDQNQNIRTYKTGFLENGGIMLDASEFNVSNIYEAVKLFEKLTNL